MVHLYRYIILIISLCTTQLVSAYGLRFRGAASPIDERTSYDVFAHSCPSFKDYFDLEFNMALYSTESVGYVLRVKGADEGQIFNLFFDFRGDDILFRLNQEGKCVLIALPVSKAEAMKSHWFKVKIAFNLKQDEITLKIHDQEKVCKGVLLSDEFSPKIVFGKSDHIIDVPEIAVDKLVVNAEHTYTFPLDEADGESVCNQEGTLYGKVENPIWLINEAYHWRKEGGFASASEAGSCYNADRNEIYYFNRDSLFVYNMETGSTSAKAFAERCPVKLFLAGSFFDSGSERLYAYEVYTENGDSEPMIASLDLHTLGWRVESYSRLSMQLHHHCSYYDAVRKRYTIFGGFGNMYYSNKFYMFSLRIKQIFCLILRYSDADGISSKQLSDLIWPDKPKDKVKNSRGVAINHLRKILKELDGIELVYEKGCFRFTLSSDFYCDYLRFMAIVAENRIEECRQEFLYIVGRGKFVGFMDGPLFDGFKQDVECLLEVLVLQLMKEAFEAQDYAETVSLAEAEFNIDPVNETALSCCLKSLFILKHENAAIGTYQKFVAEYKKYTGEDYPHPFSLYWS